MKKIVIFLACFFFFGCSYATIPLQLEASEVELGQTFRITLTLNSLQMNAVPDLRALEQDFSIVATERSVNYRLINGQAEARGQWTIVLTPNRGGLLTIPPLHIGSESTAATTIMIRPNSSKPAPLPQEAAIQLKTAVDSKNPFLNQQVIYSVKLYNSQRLMDVEYQPPQVEDALMLPLGGGRLSQETIAGREYSVEEQLYAIFPQKSGPLKMTAPLFKALVYEDLIPRRVKIQANPLKLIVKPMPALVAGENWLPAKKISLSESSAKNSQDIVVGDTWEREILVEAQGLPAQLLPFLKVEDGEQFTTYIEKPIEVNKYKERDLIGFTKTKITYSFNKAGKVTLPGLTISWFNTLSRKTEQSTLPAITLMIKPAPHTASKAIGSELQQQPSIKILAHEKFSLAMAWWLAALLALLCFFTLGCYFIYKPALKSPQKAKAVIMKRLRAACLNKNLPEVELNLLGWARIKWPERKILNVADLKKLVPDLAFQQQLDYLMAALYQKKPSDSSTWNPEALWFCVKSLKEPTVLNKSRALPPLSLL